MEELECNQSTAAYMGQSENSNRQLHATTKSDTVILTAQRARRRIERLCGLSSTAALYSHEDTLTRGAFSSCSLVELSTRSRQTTVETKQ